MPASSIRERLGSITFARLVLEKYRYLIFQYRLKQISNNKLNPSIVIGASGISSTGWIATEPSWHDITRRQSWFIFLNLEK
jgi:hypothetical protein